jgi:hypothetical protein
MVFVAIAWHITLEAVSYLLVISQVKLKKVMIAQLVTL